MRCAPTSKLPPVNADPARIRAVPSLGVKVHVEAHVAISFGLEVFASFFGLFSAFLGVFMKNSIAFFFRSMACVWCGIAFLRSSGENNSNPSERSRYARDVLLPRRGAGGSIPPLRTNFQARALRGLAGCTTQTP